MMSLLSVPIQFKEVFTTNVRNFHINPNWTMSQFIETISQHICREFNIEEDNLEIVESGQFNLGGIPPEFAPVVPPVTPAAPRPTATLHTVLH